MKRMTLLAVFLAATQFGCLVVGGATSTGGWFLWPGGLGFLVLIVLLFLFFGRRR